MGTLEIRVLARRYLDPISSYLRGRKGQFAALEFFLCGGIGLQLVIPQITRRFIDMAETGATQRTLVTVAIAFIGAPLIQQLVTVLGRYIGENLAWSVTNDMRIDPALTHPRTGRQGAEKSFLSVAAVL